MTPREQVALFLFVVCGSTIVLLALADLALEKYDAWLAREKVWRGIDKRCAMERHPSHQAPSDDELMDDWTHGRLRVVGCPLDQDQPYDWAKEEW